MNSDFNNIRKRIIVTGGAGFIGSALVRMIVSETPYEVLNLDKLTYAGNLSSLREVENSARYHFVEADIANEKAVTEIIDEFRPDAIMNLAAESHVDRSIDGAKPFMETNILGTYVMLECSRRYWEKLPEEERENFRFLHISTDEVFGSLDSMDGLFTEATPYDPRSPYSASKASSDHLVRAWGHTYGLPVLLTNCSNNYGPYHFPEKLIPLVILNALDGLELPIYGKGENIRDWLYVDDHVRALLTVLDKGVPGNSYNVGGQNEKTNLEVVLTICSILDDLRPRKDGKKYDSQIKFVTDRPGHDLRYAIDPQKLENELGWKAKDGFESGIRKTVQWYLDNEWWWGPIRNGKYSGERLGAGK